MGLVLPQLGVATCKKSHNCDPSIIADWIELCAILSEDRVSQTEIVDVLRDDEVYEDQDFAYEFVESVWSMLRSRARLGTVHYPYEVDGEGIFPTSKWKEVLPYFFQLFVSCLTWSRKYDAFDIAPAYGKQGELFEVLAEHSLRTLGWDVIRTGWSQANTQNVHQLVRRVAEHLRDEPLVDRVKVWFEDQTKEMGLDLVASRPFPSDRRCSFPAMLLQAASGANWDEKLHTPDIRSWRRVVEFTANPLRGFCIPFALTDEVLKRKCRNDLVMFDRTRILSSLPHSDSALDSWRTDAADWLETQVKVLSSIVVS